MTSLWYGKESAEEGDEVLHGPPHDIVQASVDLVYASPHNKDLVERIESRHGLHQLAAMHDLKMGNDKYELISID